MTLPTPITHIHTFIFISVQNIKSTSPDEVAQSLLNMLSNDNAPPHIKVLSAVLLRGLVAGYKSEWDSMSENAHNFIRESLVAFMTKGFLTFDLRFFCFFSNLYIISSSSHCFINIYISILKEILAWCY